MYYPQQQDSVQEETLHNVKHLHRAMLPVLDWPRELTIRSWSENMAGLDISPCRGQEVLALQTSPVTRVAISWRLADLTLVLNLYVPGDSRGNHISNAEKAWHSIHRQRV